MQCMLSGGKLAFTPYNQVLIAAAGAIPFIVEMLGADNTAAVRSRAVWALLRLMEGSASNKAKAADAGALAPLLRLAADEEGSEAKAAAKANNNYTKKGEQHYTDDCSRQKSDDVRDFSLAGQANAVSEQSLPGSMRASSTCRRTFFQTASRLLRPIITRWRDGGVDDLTPVLRASPDVAADHPSIRAVCFGPLPCLDVGLGKASSGFVTSVVNGESVR